MGTACGTSSSGDAPDAGTDSTAEAAVDARREAAPPIPPDIDASKRSCSLDNGFDPVLLCTQKLFLRAAHEAAFVAATGVLASWDATTGAPDKDNSGAFLHDVHDDVAYARACATYAASASRYGDSELTSTLDIDLATLAPLLKASLATAPDEYAGDLYMDLRAAIVGLRVLNRTADADALAAIADTIGKAIYAHFVVLSGSSLDGGAPDAGADGGVPAFDAGDAGTLPPGDGVLASDALRKDYAPDLVATGALALLDMAVRHGADDPASAAAWVSVAQQSLDHVYYRARDPGTRLYRRLLTPGAGGADDLSPRAAVPADLLATETTAAVAFALLRAQEVVDTGSKSGGPIRLVGGYPFTSRANEALDALNGRAVGLYDGDKGGYMEGWVPSASMLLTNKPTRANALALAAIHRANVLGVSPYGAQVKPLRAVLGARSPFGAGLFASSSGQNAFYASVAKGFSVPPAAYTIGDAGNVGPLVAHPNSYVTSALVSVAAAFDDEWYGYP